MSSIQTAWIYLCGIHPSLTSDFPNRPARPEHLALLDLPIRRESMSNPSRQDATWSAMNPRDMTAVLCHITGADRPKSCKRCQIGYGIFDRCVVAPSGESQAVMAGQCSNCFIDQCDQCTCIWTDEQRPAIEHMSAECRPLAANKCLPLSQPGRDDKPAEDNAPSELQPDDYSDHNELSDLSDVDEPSDEESTAEDVESIGNGDASMHPTQSQPLTEKTIPYKEVYQMARDPQAKYKHCQ